MRAVGVLTCVMSRKQDHRGRSPGGATPRQLKAGELVRRALIEVLAHEDLRDPALAGVSVTVGEVRLSPDLKHAFVFVAPLGPGDARAVSEALNRSAGFLRGRLSRAIDVKFTPDLRFLPDDSYEAAARMNALFNRSDVARDLAGDASPGPRSDED